MEREEGRVVTFTTASHQQQEEGVLNDVLQELDRERTRRAELEAQMRVVAEERALRSAAPLEEQENIIEKRQWIAMETERNELLHLVEALTSDNDAITAASKSSTASSTSLPLHVVRLLEIMPWDPRARENTIATEEVYEWQIYDAKGGKWSSHLRQFPPFFRTMPIAKPTPGQIMDEDPGRNRSRRIFGGESPPKQCVMTDSSTTRVLNIRDGFPLPNDGGTWQWIGGWRVDKRVVATPTTKLDGIQKNKVDCDENGWSYAENPRDFQTNPTELCWDTPGDNGVSSAFRRRVRRRKWTRRRALLSYPFASERTREYLKSMAENAVLEMTRSKLNDQLIETKMQLTKCEEKLMHKDEQIQKYERLEEENARLKAQSSDLNYELSKSNRQIAEFQQKLTASGSGKSQEAGSSVDRGEDGSASRRSPLENVDKIRSALTDTLTNLVSENSGKARFRSDDGTAADSDDGDDSSSSSHSPKPNETSTESNDGGPESFDWKRFGRGGVFDKIKRSPAVQSWRSPSQPDATVAVDQNTKMPPEHEKQLSLPHLK